MTMLVSAFGLLGRFAGDLLTSALSWASGLLFGRVPRSRQTLLTLMMALSFLWLLVCAGLILPGLASWLFSTTPHPSSIGRSWLQTVLIVGLIVLPPAVGLAGFLVPGEGERPRGAAAAGEILRGYLLAPVIAGLLIFLAGVGVARKVRSARHGWAAEVHVPIVAKRDGYDDLVTDLHDAVAGVDLPTTVELAPRVLTLPAVVLTRIASDGVRKLRPDRLVELKGPDLRIGVYPSDIAISGTAPRRARARAAIVSRLATAAAHLTTTADAQEVEDRLQRLANEEGTAGGRSARTIREAFDEVDAVLLELQVPPDEWDILYRMRLQVERDLLAGVAPGTSLERQPGDAAGAPVAADATSRPRRGEPRRPLASGARGPS